MCSYTSWKVTIDHFLKHTQRRAEKSSMGTHQDFTLPVFQSDLKNIVLSLSPRQLTHTLDLLNTNHKIVKLHKATMITVSVHVTAKQTGY